MATKIMSATLRRHFLRKTHKLHNANASYHLFKRPYLKLGLQSEHMYTPLKTQIIHTNIFCRLIEPKYVVHVGNMLAICAMMQSEMLYLRSFMIGASVCGIAFNLSQPIPLIAPATWGLFFILTHCVQIYYLCRDKLSVTLPKYLNTIYESEFIKAGFTPRQFMDLFEHSNGTVMTYKKGETMDQNKYSFYLMHGKVIQNDICIMDSESQKTWIGQFVYAESVRKTCSKYECLNECTVLRFDRNKMGLFLNENKSLKEKVSQIMVSDMQKKIENMKEMNILNSFVGMVHVYIDCFRNNEKRSEDLDGMRQYIQRFAVDNEINRECIDLVLQRNHAIKYEELFAE